MVYKSNVPSSWTIIFSIINIKVVWWCSKTIYQYSLKLNLESRPQHIIRSEVIWSLCKLLASNQNMFTTGMNGYISLLKGIWISSVIWSELCEEKTFNVSLLEYDMIWSRLLPETDGWMDKLMDKVITIYPKTKFARCSKTSYK